MKGTEKAKPVKDKAVKPVQVSRTKTHGSADSGNYSIDAMQASYSVQTDPAKGEQTATLAAQRCKTKTRTRSRNLSHKHTGKTSSRSITVTAETCRTTITVQRVIVTAKTQKAPAKATAPRRVSASKSARLLPAVDEDAYDGLQSRG
ncbi:MAG: hypothetical protein LUD50_06860 [Clostridia bacterium]|nr:hypothetical protein [Clostridia bacterium]